MKDIIIHPTDFSECAKSTLEFTVEICKLLNSKLKVVHILEFDGELNLDQDDSSLFSPTKKDHEKAEKKMQILLGSINSEELEVSYEIIDGEIGVSLPNYIDSINPLLVSMGTTGANNLSNKIFGSNTYSLIKNSETPVLAVPLSAEFNSALNRIVLPTNYKNKDIEVLEFLTRLAEPSQSKIDVVHVMNDQESKKSNERRLMDNLAEKVNNNICYSHISFELLYGTNIADRLQILVKEQKPDLLAMVMRKQSFFQRILFGSVTQKLVANANIPLLIFANN